MNLSVSSGGRSSGSSLHTASSVALGDGSSSSGAGGAGAVDTPCLQRHNVRVIGHGRQTLFLAHGFGTNQQTWNGVLKSLDLKTSFRVVLWDLMGAYSTSPENFEARRYSSLHAHADDLLEVLEELDLENVTYVGHSMSGMIGALASLECPERFEKLILLGASCRYTNDHATGYMGGLEVSDLDQIFATMQANYTAWASGFSSLMVGDSIDSPTVREHSRTLFLLRPDIAFLTLKMVFQSDLRDILKRVDVPVHLIQTQHDAAVPMEVAQFMAQEFPNSCVEVLPLAGHLPHLTHPSFMAEVIIRHAGMSHEEPQAMQS